MGVVNSVIVNGVLAVAVGLGVVGCSPEPVASTDQGSQPSAAATTTASAAESTGATPPGVPAPVATVVETVYETVVVDPTPILTHTGFGPISLGMTEAELLATGLVIRDPDSGDNDGDPRAYCRVFVSKEGEQTIWTQGAEGVIAIAVQDPARTPEGIMIEIHPDDPRLAAAYPRGYRPRNEFRAPLHDDVVYWFTGGGAILTRTAQLCFG